MADYARWTPLPKRNLLSTLSRVPAWQWVIVLSLVALMSYMRWTIGAERGESIAIRLSFVPLFSLLALLPLTSMAMNRPSAALRDLARKQIRKGYSVRMTVLEDDVPIGQDEGLVFIVGEELEYIGLQTSFHISTNDVEVPEQFLATGALWSEPAEKWRFGNAREHYLWGFVVRDHPKFRIHFFPLAANDGSVYRPLHIWYRQPPGETSSRTLPPLEPLPGYKAPAR